MARNTGKRPHEITLELFEKNPTLTPTEIDAAVGVGNYSSKHIWFLRKLGYDITVNKSGRNVLSYVYHGPGSAVVVTSKTKPVVEVPGMLAAAPPKPMKKKAAVKKKAAASKSVKTAKKAPAATKKVAATKTEEAPDGEPSRSSEEIRAENLARMKLITAKLTDNSRNASAIRFDVVEETFGSNGEIGSSFSIDPAWDYVDHTAVRDFLRC
jgi:hypothetical protein